MAKRLQAMRNKRYINGFQVTVHKDLFQVPLNVKKPSIIFVNSMSDLFHEEIEDSIIIELFEVMRKAKWHIFQVLTKRAERLLSMSNAGLIDWPDNVWMGVTVENDKNIDRIECLRNTGAKIKFLSCEPLLGSLGDINLTNIHWVIVGGESGPKARTMEKVWVDEIKEKCAESKVPFFFKQWGGINKKKNGRVLDGKFYNDMPKH
jgi:protein gp37